MNLVTGKVRFSYVNVFEPKEIGGEEKYSITLLIPKSDTLTYNNIKSMVEKTIQEALAEKFNGVRPTNLMLPIYDGDGMRPNGEAFGPECKGCWVMTAKSKQAPEVVDASLNPIISKKEFYSGCFGKASISFYAYNKNGNKGVGCGLGNIQKLEDGQPLDGRTTALEDFGTPIAQTAPVYSATQSMAPVDPITGQPQYQALITPTQQYQMPQSPVQPQPQYQTQNPINNIYEVN